MFRFLFKDCLSTAHGSAGGVFVCGCSHLWGNAKQLLGTDGVSGGEEGQLVEGKCGR